MQLAAILKYNKNHEPAGSPKGGQFSSGKGGNNRALGTGFEKKKVEEFSYQQNKVISSTMEDAVPYAGEHPYIPKKGDRFIVFRIAGESVGGLQGKNGADSVGVANFIEDAMDFEKPTGGSNPLSHIHAYEVTMTADATSDYRTLNRTGGDASEAGKAVGVNAQYGGREFSFPKEGKGYRSRYLGSVEARPLIRDMDKKGIYVVAADIEKAFVKRLKNPPPVLKFDSVFKFNPNHYPAGSPKGGQFAPGKSSSKVSWDEAGNFTKSFGIERKDMPQVRTKDQAEFLDFAKDKGVSVERGEVSVSDLKPTQKHFNPAQVAQMSKDSLDYPLMISADNHVLDGTNRFIRNLIDTPDKKLKVIRIGLPVKEALALMKSFPKVGYKDVSQIGATKKADISGSDLETAGKKNSEQHRKYRRRYQMKLDQIFKFNPHHDPKNGQFTSGSQGELDLVGGSGGKPPQELPPEEKQRSPEFERLSSALNMGISKYLGRSNSLAAGRDALGRIFQLNEMFKAAERVVSDMETGVPATEAVTNHFNGRMVRVVENIINKTPWKVQMKYKFDQVFKFNPNHHPAGSPKGGQFAPGKGGSGGELPWGAGDRRRDHAAFFQSLPKGMSIDRSSGGEYISVSGEVPREARDKFHTTLLTGGYTRSPGYTFSGANEYTHPTKGTVYTSETSTIFSATLRNKALGVMKTGDLEKIFKFNPNHHPAGAPGGRGGQFAPAKDPTGGGARGSGGGGSGPKNVSGDEALRWMRDMEKQGYKTTATTTANGVTETLTRQELKDAWIKGGTRTFDLSYGHEAKDLWDTSKDKEAVGNHQNFEKGSPGDKGMQGEGGMKNPPASLSSDKPSGPRPIHEIARDIRRVWSKQGKGVNYAAKPYLEAMGSLETTKDKYIMDSGESVVAYFLGNATSFRGPEAKKLKDELKAHLKRKSDSGLARRLALSSLGSRGR